MKQILFIVAISICGLFTYSCNKTSGNHVHSHKCQHDHADEKAKEHIHGEDCDHNHDHDHHIQESFTVEPESN